MANSISTSAKLGGRHCLIPDPDKYGVAVARKANGFLCPRGCRPGIAYALMLDRDWSAISAGTHLNSAMTMELTAGATRLTFPGLYVVSATRITPGGANDRNAAYLIKLADARWLAKFSDVNRQFNVRCPAPPRTGGTALEYYSESLNGGTAWTWAEIVQRVWLDIGTLGAWPGLPVVPSGTPDGLQFVGVSGIDALETLLARIECTLVYQHGTGVISIKALGVVQDGLAATLAANPLYIDDADPARPAATDVPATVRVYFHRVPLDYGTHPETGRTGNWAMGPVYSVDVASGVAGAKSGTIVGLWDDLPAVFNFDGTYSNSAALATRAAARAADWILSRRVSNARFRRQFSGLIDTRPGSQVNAVLWAVRAPSMGLATTEIACSPIEPEIDDSDAGGLCMRWLESAENLDSPDIARRTWPNYPHLMHVVTVTGSGSTGDPVSITANGLFPGKVTRVNVEADTGTTAPYTQEENCWVLVVDRVGGSSTSTTKLKQGDRYIGKLNGSKLLSADGRPVYAIQLAGSGGGYWVEGTLYNAMPLNPSGADPYPKVASCPVTDYWGGANPGATITVWDSQSLFAHAPTGAKFKAVYDELEDRFKLVTCDPWPRVIEGNVAEAFDYGMLAFTITTIKHYQGAWYAAGAFPATHLIQNPPSGIRAGQRVFRGKYGAWARAEWDDQSQEMRATAVECEDGTNTPPKPPPTIPPPTPPPPMPGTGFPTTSGLNIFI